MGMVTDPLVPEALVPLLLRHIQVDRQRTAGSIDGLVARDFRVLDDGEPF